MVTATICRLCDGPSRATAAPADTLKIGRELGITPKIGTSVIATGTAGASAKAQQGTS
jgi:hypothetical protein